MKANVNFSMWIESFTSILDRHVPIKTKRVKLEKQPEWFNNDIKEASLKRDVYHKQKKIGVDINIGETKLKNWYNFKKGLSNAIQGNKTNTFSWKHVRKLCNPKESSRIPDE